MRQVPTRFVHTLIVKTILETRAKVVQITADPKFRNTVIELVRD